MNVLPEVISAGDGDGPGRFHALPVTHLGVGSLSLLVQPLGALANAALAQRLAASDGKCLACRISDTVRQARQAGGYVVEVARRIIKMLCYGSIESNGPASAHRSPASSNRSASLAGVVTSRGIASRT